MSTNMPHTQCSSNVQKSYERNTRTTKKFGFLFLGLFPLFVACGTPEWNSWSRQTTPFQYDSAQQNGLGASSQGSSSLSVDTSSRQEGCEGFKSRPGTQQVPEGTILAVMESKGNNTEVLPLQLTSTKTLKFGDVKRFQGLNTTHKLGTTLTMDGHELYVVTPRASEQFQVERHMLFVADQKVQSHKLSQSTRTIHAYNGYVYTTENQRIRAFDLNQANVPSCPWGDYFTDLPATGEYINLMTRDDNQLLALDNTPEMKYLYVHTLGANGLRTKTFGAPLALRRQLNYQDMKLQEGLVVLYGSYKKDERVGHLLATYQIQEQALKPLGEHDVVPAPSGAEAEPVKPWQGLGIIRNHVVVSSPRGSLLMFDANLHAETRKEVFLRGQAQDILVKNDTVYVLVEDALGVTLHLLSWDLDTQSLSLSAIFRLPGHPTKFVH